MLDNITHIAQIALALFKLVEIVFQLRDRLSKPPARVDKKDG